MSVYLLTREIEREGNGKKNALIKSLSSSSSAIYLIKMAFSKQKQKS